MKKLLFAILIMLANLLFAANNKEVKNIMGGGL